MKVKIGNIEFSVENKKFKISTEQQVGVGSRSTEEIFKEKDFKIFLDKLNKLYYDAILAEQQKPVYKVVESTCISEDYTYEDLPQTVFRGFARLPNGAGNHDMILLETTQKKYYTFCSESPFGKEFKEYYPDLYE